MDTIRSPRNSAARSAPAPDTRLRLEGFLPYRLSVLSNAVSGAIARLYEREFGLTIPQWRAIAVIADEGAPTAAEIARATRMDKVAVSRAVSALVKRRLIVRRASQSDGRAAHLELTAAGRRVYERVVPRAREAERRLLAGLSERDRAKLAALIAALDRAAEGLEAL